jgi:three-Cys-motif partner protein
MVGHGTSSLIAGSRGLQFDGPEGENENFFDDELRVWSQRKLRILDQYMASYVKKRGSNRPRLYYVDGFAGRGTYGTSEPFEDGSPLKIARLAQKIKDENQKYRLYCMNSEINSTRCARLKDVLSFVDPELVTTFCGPFNAHLETMMGQMRGCPAVYFLDPCGIIGIAPHELQPVVARPDTEILLTLSLPTLFRMSGSADSFAPEALGKVAQLSRVLGEDPADPNPEWAQMKNELDTESWADWAVHRYMKRIQKLSSHLRYGLSYPIREKFKSGTKYYLIFATRSMGGFPFMTDFICSEEDALQLEMEIESRKQGQLSLFAPRHETNREEQFPSVIEEIHQYGLEHQGCTRKEIIEQISFRHLGQFKQKHIRYMVRQLVESGRAAIYDGSDKATDIDRRSITFI